MTKDKALDLAQEALGLYQAAGFGNSTDFNKQHEAFYKAQTAITATKQARALDKKAENARELGLDYEPVREDWGPGPHEVHSLPPAAPVQEPVAIIEQLWAIIDDIDTYGDMAKSDDKLYRGMVERRQKDRWKTGITTDGYTLNVPRPPAAQRPFVGLTDAEVLNLEVMPRMTIREVYAVIESALKQKNT